MQFLTPDIGVDLMSGIPDLSRAARKRISSDSTAMSSVSQPNPTQRPPGRWQQLLRPQVVEKAVLLADFVLIVSIGLICSLTYLWAVKLDSSRALSLVGVGLIFAFNFTALMAARHNYSLKALAQFTRQARDATLFWCAIFAMLAIAGFVMKISEGFSRGSTILFFLAGLAALTCWRLLVARLISAALASGSFAKKNVIVVAQQDKSLSSRSLQELQRYGYHPVKICDITSQEIAAPGILGSLKAKLADVIEAARHQHIEDIYLSVDWQHHRTIDCILDALAVLPISVHLVPDASAARFLNYPSAPIGSTWALNLRRPPLSTTERAAKRFFDVSLAIAGLALLAPLMLITALLVKLDSRGPVFFRQSRNGFNGRAFKIFKFRTMHVLEDGPELRQATRNDPRVTRVGRWLRRSSIDELPQLFNVIPGHMSLVGPRPHATSHNTEYESLIANYAFRHHVKPGLTGWAQVNGHRGETRLIEQMERRVEHDLWYINNWSLILDLRIVLQTATVALRQTTAY
jgi:Undecaprenyl-phosphate glucose phosphotransferase